MSVSQTAGAPGLTARMETALPLERRTATTHAALLAVVVVWAGAFSVIKALIDHGFAAEDIALLRYLIAAPGFAFLLVRVGGLPGLTRRDALRLAAVGVCVVVGYHISLNVGTKYTTSGTAALVIALSPALTLLLAVGLGLERWSLRRATGIAVAFAGVAIVVLLGAGGELSFANAKGPLIVLAAPVSFALYNVLLKPLLSRYDFWRLPRPRASSAASSSSPSSTAAPSTRSPASRSATPCSCSTSGSPPRSLATSAGIQACAGSAPPGRSPTRS
jgi:drug/metabolite transporter (DMT)-like permease